MFEGLAIVRNFGGLGEDPNRIELTRPVVGTRPSDSGLPSSLDEGSWVLLFLSPSCPACFQLANALVGVIDDRLRIVVTGVEAASLHEWLADVRLPREKCIVDDTLSIADKVGINGTPVAVVVEHGLFARAMTVPSKRGLDTLIGKLGESVP